MKIHITKDSQTFKMTMVCSTDKLSSLRVKLEQPQHIVFVSDGSEILQKDEDDFTIEDILNDLNGKKEIIMKTLEQEMTEFTLLINDIPIGVHKVIKDQNLAQIRIFLKIPKSSSFIGSGYVIDKKDEIDFPLEETLVDSTLSVQGRLILIIKKKLFY